MRRKKVLALVLALCLSMTTVTPASAAGFSSGRSSGFSFSWSSIWDRLFGGLTQTPAEPETGTETSTGSGGTMTLVEDETTVSEGTALRASTYALTAADTPTTYANSTNLKYFPVTLYNYDKTTINNATHQVEVERGLGNTWNGIYFNDGNPSAESYTYSTGGEVSYTEVTVNYKSNGRYNDYINNGYYVDVNGTKHLVTGLSCTRSWFFGYTYSWTITYAGGTATSSDSSITLYRASTGSTATTARLSYADWNHWDKSYSK